MQHFIFFLAIFAGASINKQIMSYRIIAPATCDTTINLPASKSISNLNTGSQRIYAIATIR